jgi:hypothetical protein
MLGPQLPERRARCDRGVQRVVALNDNVERAIDAHAHGQLTQIGLLHEAHTLPTALARIQPWRDLRESRPEATFGGRNRERRQGLGRPARSACEADGHGSQGVAGPLLPCRCAEGGVQAEARCLGQHASERLRLLVRAAVLAGLALAACGSAAIPVGQGLGGQPGAAADNPDLDPVDVAARDCGAGVSGWSTSSASRCR